MPLYNVFDTDIDTFLIAFRFRLDDTVATLLTKILNETVGYESRESEYLEEMITLEFAALNVFRSV